VVPVENSTGGVVSHTLDELVHTKLRICGEVTLPVHHHLLSKHKTLKQVKKVYSHSQSFAQCRKWLDAKLQKAEREPVASNAQAAVLAKKNGGAAIASLQAGKIYGLSTSWPRISRMTRTIRRAFSWWANTIQRRPVQT
jgi:chorismate mutase / prephenate dehydratase